MTVILVVTTEFSGSQLGCQEWFWSTELVAVSSLRVVSITSLSIKLFFGFLILYISCWCWKCPWASTYRFFLGPWKYVCCSVDWMSAVIFDLKTKEIWGLTFLLRYVIQVCWQLAVSRPVWHIPFAVCTVKNSWWWTEELSETCRVLFQK